MGGRRVQLRLPARSFAHSPPWPSKAHATLREMRAEFEPCSGCHRHVYATSAHCPFCNLSRAKGTSPFVTSLALATSLLAGCNASRKPEGTSDVVVDAATVSDSDARSTQPLGDALFPDAGELPPRLAGSADAAPGPSDEADAGRRRPAAPCTERLRQRSARPPIGSIHRVRGATSPSVSDGTFHRCGGDLHQNDARESATLRACGGFVHEGRGTFRG